MSFFHKSRVRRCCAVIISLMWAVPGTAAICSVSTQSVSFGKYDPFQLSPLDGVGSVSLSCDSVVSASVSLSSGAGTYPSRLMDNGFSQLSYNLYTDTQRMIVWGDGSGGTGTVSTNAQSSDLTVYGTISARQNVTAGAYQDTIIVTVTY